MGWGGKTGLTCEGAMTSVGQLDMGLKWKTGLLCEGHTVEWRCVCVSVCVWKKYVGVILLGLSSSGPCKFLPFITH